MKLDFSKIKNVKLVSVEEFLSKIPTSRDGPIRRVGSTVIMAIEHQDMKQRDEIDND
jgi:hypothetical protein